MSTTPPNPAATLERDPVCGMNVNPATAKHVHDHGGKNFYFCCASCKEKFKADPEKYLTPPARSSGLLMLGTAKPPTSSERHQTRARTLQTKTQPLSATQGTAYV